MMVFLTIIVWLFVTILLFLALSALTMVFGQASLTEKGLQGIKLFGASAAGIAMVFIVWYVAAGWAG